MLIISTKEQNSEAELFAMMLESQGIRYKTMVDLPTAMRVAEGKLNPACGTIVVAPDGKKLFSMFDICAWIDEQGLRLL
jgi:hypothetical protein